MRLHFRCVVVTVLRMLVLLIIMMDMLVFSAEMPLGYRTVQRLDQIVVTARGTEGLISQTPGGVGRIDTESISAEQPVSLGNVVRRIPGVEKSSDSAWGSAINIRGLGRNNVVFLIDGCRINTATDINARFGLVNPSDVERIEILKGPVSALYGSGSLGGVVNVITRKGYFANTSQWHGETALTYKDNPRGLDTYGNVSFNSPDRWVFASGSYRDHHSYEAGNGEKIDNSQFRDHHAKAGMGLKWNSMNVTEIKGQYVEAKDVGIPGKGLSLPSGPDVTYLKAALSLLNMTHTFTPEQGVLRESRLNLFYQKVQRQVLIDHFPESAPLNENSPGADHKNWGFKWRNRFDLGVHTLVTGSDVWDWKITNSNRYKTFKNGLTGVDSPLGDVEQVSGGLFAEDDWRMGEQVILNIGGRVDYIRAESNDLYNWVDPPSSSMPVVIIREGDYYNDVSWNAHTGLTWNFVPGWSMTFIAASSYRAPDLMDRFKYISLGGGVELFGNPDLDPERSFFIEYGLHYNTMNLQFTASTYANYLNDLITEQKSSDTVHCMENVDNAEIYGGEIDVEWYFLPEWSAYANAAFADGKNTTTDENLPFIPPLNGLTGVRYDDPAGFWGSLEMMWAAGQNRVPSGNRESSSWETLNLRAGYRFGTARIRHELMIGVDNLFNRDYRNYLSTSRDIELKEPGVSFLACWKMRF